MSLSSGALPAWGIRSIMVRLMLVVEAPSLVRRLLSRASLNSWVLASSAVCAAVSASGGVASRCGLTATGLAFGLFFVLLTMICGRRVSFACGRAGACWPDGAGVVAG